jgi:hypothetical protein
MPSVAVTDQEDKQADDKMASVPESNDSSSGSGIKVDGGDNRSDVVDGSVIHKDGGSYDGSGSSNSIDSGIGAMKRQLLYGGAITAELPAR